MTGKTKQFLLFTFFLLLSATGIIFIDRFALTNSDRGLDPILGLILGTVLIGLIQEWLAPRWIYQIRYLVYGVGFAIGMVAVGVLDFVFHAGHSSLARVLLFDGIFGMGMGLVGGLFMLIADVVRERATPYSGAEVPLMTSNSTMWYGPHSFTKGRLLLLSDKMVFLVPGSPEQTIQFAHIRKIDFLYTLGFTNKLNFLLKDAGSVVIGVPMAKCWKRKIESHLSHPFSFKSPAPSPNPSGIVTLPPKP